MPADPAAPSADHGATGLRVVLLGAPGAGKGTQGPVLAERLGVPYLSTGDLLRDQVAQGTDLGRRVQATLESGELLPDDLMVDVVVGHLTGLDGYVLDGFPRTIDQAEAAADRLPGGLADAVVFLVLPDDVARDRLARRDEGRADDADPRTIDHRLDVFHTETEPLVGHYRTKNLLHEIDADRPPGTVLSAIASSLTP